MATMMTTTRTRGDGALAPSPMTTGGLVIPAKAGTYWMRLAYAKAGTYPDAARPDRSTLSRRVRGVLSPYRERGIRALARLKWIRGSRFRGNDGQGGRCARYKCAAGVDGFRDFVYPMLMS